jgi:hypothetical protein
MLEAEQEYLNNKQTIWSESLNVINQSIIASFETALNGDNGINTQLDAIFDKSTDLVTTIGDNLGLIGQQIALQTGAMIANGEDLLKSFAKSVFSTIKALVPAFVTQIFGTSIGTLGPIAGPIASGILTGSLYALLGVAENAILGLKNGMINISGAGTTTSDSIPAMLSKGESVINARSTAINEPFLRFANNGGDLGKLFSMNINNNNSNLESLMVENNNILRSKNLSVNNVNKFNVSSKNISIVRGR